MNGRSSSVVRNIRDAVFLAASDMVGALAVGATIGYCNLFDVDVVELLYPPDSTAAAIQKFWMKETPRDVRATNSTRTIASKLPIGQECVRQRCMYVVGSQ